MKLLFRLAWRNLWRNKRRSLITITAVSFAVMLSIAMRGLQLGTYDVNIRHAVELYSGYLQIQKTGYQQNPSLQKSFRFDPAVQKIIEQQPEITAYAPRVVSDGLVSFQDNSLGAAIIGIDIEKEKSVTTFLNKINNGRVFSSDSAAEIVVGEKLLRNLNAKLGDRVVVLSQGFDGSLGNLKFTIVGTLKTGSADYDVAAVLMGLSAAQDLLTMYGRINLIALSLANFHSLPEVKAALQQKLSRADLAVLDWKELMPDLYQAIELDNVSGILFLAILVVVVAFGIMNTILMSVTERFREFGVSLSIGMPQGKLVLLVFLETVFIALIGIALGNLLAAGINYYIVQHPIVLSGDFADLYAEYGFLPRLESTLQPGVFINSTVTIFVVSLITAIYPIYKVYRLEPLKGISYT